MLMIPRTRVTWRGRSHRERRQGGGGQGLGRELEVLLHEEVLEMDGDVTGRHWTAHLSTVKMIIFVVCILLQLKTKFSCGPTACQAWAEIQGQGQECSGGKDSLPHPEGCGQQL